MAMPLGGIDPSGGMSFLVLLPRLVRPFGFLANSAEDRMLLALVEKSAPVLGGIVLGAKDLSDLDGRFDEALDRPEFSEFLAGIAKVVPILASLLDDSALTVELESLASVLGDGLRAKLREGDAIIVELVRCFGRLAPAPGDLAAALSSAERGRPLAFLEDPTIPLPIARALLDSLKLQVAMLAIGETAGRRARPEPWLALALAERLVRGLRAQLVLLALIPGANVRQEVLPREMRIDPAVIESELAHMKEALEAAKLNG